MSSSRFRMEVWKGEWNLPSVDPECIRAITFARFSEAPVALVINSAPWSAPGGVYPLLTTERESFSGADAIVKYLRSQDFQCPYEANLMTPYEEADAYAMDTYLKSSLAPLLEYLWWVDDEAFRRITVPFYQNDVSYYGQFVWMHHQRKRISNRMLVTSDSVMNPGNTDHLRRKVAQKAKRCLEDLSVKLGDKTFLFGLKPSALDSTAFAYLAPLFYIPWKNKEIRKDIFADKLDKFQNLKSYVDRIRKRYFEGSPFSVEIVNRPQYWYHRIFERLRKHSDVLVFIGAAILMNAYLLNRTVHRLRFQWPGLDDHAKQKLQGYGEMMKNLGLTIESAVPPSV